MNSLNASFSSSSSPSSSSSSSSPSTSTPAGSNYGDSLNKVGLGYGIAIAVGILVLVSTIMLASYVCVKLHGRPGPAHRRERPLDLRSLEEIIIASPGGGGGGGGGSSSSPAPGLDEATLQSYPKTVYEKPKKKKHQRSASSDRPDAHDASTAAAAADGCCSICLADYSDGEVLRLLPDCGHAFHVACIDAWLRLQATCPMCRSSPLPTPTSTPLSELIPLARNPLGNVRYTIQNIL